MNLYSEILVKDLNSIKSNIDSTFNALMVEQESDIRYMIYQRWLLGKRPDGTRIGVYRDLEYQEFKYFKNPLAGGEVDLIDTGALWKGIEIFNTSKGIEIFSTDSKYNEIAEKYGDDNFNITDKEEQELIDEISTLTIELLYKKYLL
jgi:hypothetical protein